MREKRSARFIYAFYAIAFFAQPWILMENVLKGFSVDLRSARIPDVTHRAVA